MTGDPTERRGRADLHIHTLASDGTASVAEILDRVEREAVLDVIAITDHERIDAALAARPWPRMVACRAGGGGRGDQDPRRPPAGAVPGAARSGCGACAGPWPPSTSRAASPSRPTRSSRTRCAPRGSCSAGCSTTPTRPSGPTRSRRSTPPRSAATGTSGSSGSPRTTACPRSATATPTRRRRGIGLDDASRAGPPTTSAPRSSRADGPSRRLPRHRRPARDVRSAAAQARPRRARRGRRPAAPRRHGRDHGYPGGHHRPPRFEPADADAGRAMKIGLVSPYVYPLPGGVTQHVRYLYENLRLRGHDVRILTSSHGLQRASEGDVIRLGKGFSMPANGSVGTVTLSPRYISQVREVLDRERFDVLHFHEPFVPFLSLVLLRESKSVNIGTFHAYGGWSPAYEFGSRAMRSYADRLHGRIAVSAAARHFIDRYFPGDYKVIPNGVDIDALPPRRPGGPLAGRHREHPVRRAVRAPQGRARPAAGVPDPAQDRLRVPAAPRRRRAAGARGPPLHRDPPAPRRRVPGAGLRRREGAAVPDRGRVRVAGDRPRVVRDRAARGDGLRGADRRVGHPRLQGRRAARPRGAARPAAPAQGDRELDRPAARRPETARATMSRPGCARPRSSAGRG